tara:strand:- start:2486 stop:2779 length:294 start_codon:yes stop_codon:yes gene_type:complete
MPDKILAALSPAYGIATGTGPYKHFLGSLGRAHYDRAEDKRKRKKEEAADLAELNRVKTGINTSSYNQTVEKKMMHGGRTKPVDGCAIKGKTKPPVF